MKTLIIALVLSLGMIGLSLAGPERPVLSQTFQVQAPSGPFWDLNAAQGQWFMDPANGLTHVKPWEFHDDDDTLCINGIVKNIIFDGLSNIVAFTVLATVTNNLPSSYQQTASSNSHNEVQSPPYPSYSGSMQEVRIVAEFAVPDMTLVPPIVPPPSPYFPDPVSGTAYYIEAMNEDELAWYCWAPGGPVPQGNFQVPTWRLPSIPPGGSASVPMLFQITSPSGPAAMPKSDYRHSVIRHSYTNQSDIFYARHPSLKVSHWLDTLLVDYGSGSIGALPGTYEPEPPPTYVYASNVSVFFDPEADFGDAPDPALPTLLASNGARHLVVPGVSLGSLIDAEPEGQPNPSALGDDTVGSADEDGVALSGVLIRGSNATFQVAASTNGYLNAWIDFNQNRSWLDGGDQIVTNVSLSAGTNAVSFIVPPQAAWGTTYGRFRFCSLTGLQPTGFAFDGEVEDYAFTVYQPKPTTTLAITNVVCSASNTLFTIRWNGESPLVYETQYTDVLSSNITWTAWGSYVGSSPYEQTNSITGITSRFYRVSAPYTAP